MRNKNSIRFTTVIMLFSILSVFCEFFLLHIMEDDLKATLIGAGIVLLISVILLVVSYNFEAIFSYIFLNVVLSSLLAAYNFWEINYFYYSVTDYRLWMIIVNYSVPWLVCLFLSMFDLKRSFLNYRQFIRNVSLLFLVFYVAIFVYVEFVPHSHSMWENQITNYIPFYTTAAYIEDYIYHVTTLKNLVTSILLPALLYVPSGFFICLCLRHQNRWLRLLPLLILPILSEVIQFLLQVNYINVDDIIYGLLGGLIGQVLFLLLNGLFLLFKGEEFIEEKEPRRPELHF